MTKMLYQDKTEKHLNTFLACKGDQIFVWAGTYYVPCQKRLCKIKHGFEGQF